MKLGALIFQPKLLPKIWGGRRLQAWGKALPEGQAIGESWDLYDRPKDSAVVSEGPLKGETLSSVTAEFGPALLGQKAFERGAPYFPLMVKLIDAQEALSVQVHPDDEQALRMVGPDELGKTEAWVVLEAAPGARLTAGLKQGTTRDTFREALAAGRLESLLNTFEVKAGDVVSVPAGRVHAIGKGCLVAEIQQNSDTTWRVYDYGRLEEGKPRALHLSQAMDCIRFDAEMQGLPNLQQGRKLSGMETLLVENNYFKISRLEFAGAFKPSRQERAFQLLTVTQGSLRLKGEGVETRIGRGQTVLLPAMLDWELESDSGPASVLWSRA